MKVWEVKKVIYETKIAEYLRDGMAVSDPLPVMQKDRLVNLYLVYYVNVKKNTMSEPLFTFTIDTEKGTLISLEKWNDRIWGAESSQIQEKLEDNKKEAEKKKAHETGKESWNEIEISHENIEVRKKAKEEYEVLYSEVREFFYQDNLTWENKEKIQRFYHVFCLYAGEGKIYFYKKAVPQFFEWMERMK